VPFKLHVIILLSLTTFSCAADFGALSATSWGASGNLMLSGRAKPSMSLGMETQIPLDTPEKQGEWGLVVALPYEEFLTETEHAANLSEGRLRSQSAGAVWKILRLRSTEPANKYVWFGAGPEYRWNSFVESNEELAYAAANGTYYDEDMKENWGLCIRGGYDFLPSGILMLELGYHWFQTRTVVKGVSGGVPFRWGKTETMQWLSCFLGFRLRF